MNGNQNQHLNSVKERYGGELSEPELEFLRIVQQIFKKVIDKKDRFNFNPIIKNVAELLSEINKFKYNLDSVHNFDMRQLEEAISSNTQTPTNGDMDMTEKEEEFTRDIIASIEFVIRNGIGFRLIAGALSHDFAEIIKHGKLDNAVGFEPKISGWANFDENMIGDPDEPEF